MISTEDIFKALRDAIKKAVPQLYVTAEHLQNPAQNYAWVQFRPLRIDEGYGSIRRQIRAVISVVLIPDEFSEVYHSDLYEIADALDVEFCGYVKVNDRFIPLYETSARIFDNILHYEFVLDFADYIDKIRRAEVAGRELMQELQMKNEN